MGGGGKGSDYQKAYDVLEKEFELARTLIEARVAAGLTQAQVAIGAGRFHHHVHRATQLFQGLE